MDNNTSPTNDENLYLVWYEEGQYTQRRFLVKGEENARKTVERLNEEFECEEEEGYEAWNYEPIDFNGNGY